MSVAHESKNILKHIFDRLDLLVVIDLSQRIMNRLLRVLTHTGGQLITTETNELETAREKGESRTETDEQTMRISQS